MAFSPRTSFEVAETNDTRRPILGSEDEEPFVEDLGRDEGVKRFGIEKEESLEVVHSKDKR